MKGATQYRHVFLRLDQMEPHPDVQRMFDEAWANRIASDFDPDMFGAVSLVPNGVPDRYWIFDGQHRWAAAAKALGADQRVPCHLFPKLPVERVARLFRGVNNFKVPRFFDQFRMRLKEGEPSALAIRGILAKHGLIVTFTAVENGVRAVAACDAIYRRASGPELLAETIGTLKKAWGGNPDAYHQSILQGTSTFIRRYGGKYEQAALVRTLAARWSPVRLLGDARAFAKMSGISTGESVTRRIVNEYNKRRSKGRLEE